MTRIMEDGILRLEKQRGFPRVNAEAFDAGTFIMPHGKNRPAIYTDPRGRLKLEWKRLKQRFMDSLG